MKSSVKRTSPRLVIQLPGSAKNARRERAGQGFVLIELPTEIAIIAILAGLLLPALSPAKLKAQGIQCTSNHRSLAPAWKMYADDDNESIPFSAVIDQGSPEANSRPYPPI